MENIEKIQKENAKILDIILRKEGIPAIIDDFQKEVGFKMKEVETNVLIGKPTKFLVIDETQKLFKKEFDEFWQNIRSITEVNKNIKILCLASQTTVLPEEFSREDGTPMVFHEKNTKNLSFLRFTKKEVQEILESYYEDFYEGYKFKIDQDMINYIETMTGNHAELLTATIMYLSTWLKNKDPWEKDFKKVKEMMNSHHYHGSMNSIKTLIKNFPGILGD